jgi:hypothetical protein
MAERRMFAKTIIDSDAFLDMSMSAQALYFHLAMRADDEGFVNNPKKIQRMTGASDDDLKILIAKKFIIPFESGIVVIKHWKIHNYIRGDRIQETKYHKEKHLLSLNENGSYTLTPVSISGNVTSESPQERTVRQMAYDKSSLPYSFDYKIRNAFYGKTCPVCGATMVIDKEFGGRNSIPSIQHNVPVSKGGEHEIGNISVICKQCNVTLQDKETDSLNADEVAVVWDELSGKCQASDGQLSDKCQHRLGKDSIVQDSIVEPPKAAKQTKHQYGLYKNVLLSDDDYQKLKVEFPSDYATRIDRLSEGIESKGYKYKNHLATIRVWARNEKENPKSTGKRVSFQNYDQGAETPYIPSVDVLAEARAGT